MVDTDKLAQQLHTKASLGMALSAEEKAHVERWYAKLDQEECAILSRTIPSQAHAELQAQIDAALLQLADVTRRSQELTAEIESVRKENADLRRQLAQRSLAQSV